MGKHKRLLLSLLAVILIGVVIIILMYIYTARFPDNSIDPITEFNCDDVTFSIDDFDQDARIITISILNHSNEEINMATYYLLQKYDNKKWVDIPGRNTEFKADAICLLPNDKFTDEIWLEIHYPGLSSGKYRIYKQIAGGYGSAEFTIEPLD